MARTIVDEELKYTVIINGNKAQKELFDLERAQKSLKDANKALREEKAKLISQGKRESDEYKRVTAEIKKNNQEIKQNQTRQVQLRKELGLNALTMKQLKDEARRLRLQLHNMTPGSKEYIKYNTQLARVQTRMRELRQDSTQTRASLHRFSSSLQSYAVKGASFLALLTGIGYSLRSFLGLKSNLSDALADVAKTTGFTNEELEELQEKLNKLDTRTSRIALLGLAEEAGRLGKDSVDDVAEFVAVADQIKVALGDDLGGDANENVRLIGKLTEQYQVGARAGVSFGDGMTMVGSAINEVSASGSANAGFITDYTQRLVGVSSVTKMLIEDQIGYAAVLDESGQSVEVSGTAMSKLIMDMAGNIGEYAAIAGKSEGAFRALFNEDANEAVLQFLEGLNGNNAGLEQMAIKLDSLGVDGARATSVLAALSTQTDKVREKQDLANEALNEATSLMDEFIKKNTNEAAVLEKIRKLIVDGLIDSKLSKWISSSIIWFGKFIGVVEDTDGSVTAFKDKVKAFGRVLLIAGTAVISYQAALKLLELWSKRAAAATALQNLQTRLSTAINAAARGSALLLSAAKFALTGNITKARNAMTAFNAATKANPIGLLLTVLATAYTAWSLYADEVDEATEAQKAIVSANTAAQQSIAGEIAQLQSLVRTARNENLTREQRIKAVEELRKLAPGYLEDLTLEKIGHEKTAEAIEDYIAALEKRAIANAIQEKREELQKQMFEEYGKSLESNVRWYHRLGAAMLSLYGSQVDQGVIIANVANARHQDVAAIQRQIDALNEYEQMLLEAGKIDIGTEDEEENGGGGGGGELSDKEKQAMQRYRDEMKRLYEEVNEMRRSTLDQEVERINEKYEFMLNAARGNEELLAEIRAFKQAEIDELLQTREEEHQQKILETRRRYQLLSDQERHQLELAELERAYEMKLLTEEEYQRARAALIEQYETQQQNNFDQAQRDRIKAYQDEVRMYQDIIGSMASAVTSFRDAELARIEEVSRRQGESEEEYTARREAAEEERSEIMKKYAGIELLVKIAQITASTAVAFMSAMELPWPANLIAAGAVTAAGAGQIAVAKAEYDRVQGYEEGLYPVRDQHGRAFQARRVANVGTGMVNDPSILVGEKPELVIDPRTTRFLEANAPEIIDSIYHAANRVRGISSPTSSTSSQRGTTVSMANESRAQESNIAAVLEKLYERLRYPITANVGDDQAKNINRLREDLDEIERTSRIQRTA